LKSIFCGNQRISQTIKLSPKSLLWNILHVTCLF
jgi:hypothetical protein